MKIHFWNTVAIVFYIALVVCGYNWLVGNELFPRFVPGSDLIIIALAVMRLVRLFTYDAITLFIRNWFLGRDPETFLGTLGVLIRCPWCTGLWFAALTLFAYLAWPIAWFFILILAIAALGSSMQVAINSIGRSSVPHGEPGHVCGM